MTECNTKRIEFSRVQRRELIADFAGGRLTSDAGSVLLREVEKKTDLFSRIDRIITDPRVPEKITHQQRTLLAQRIMAIAMGYEDVNDHGTLRTDPALQVAASLAPEEDQPLGSPSTLSRLENRITRQELVEMNALLVELFIESHDEAPEEIILDFDATDDPTHGNQEKSFFHGYYDHYCFLPLYVFCDQQLLCAYLRPSRLDGATHAWAILSLLVKRFREVWPEVRIVFRGDSGFCRRKMLNWCEKNDVDYIVGIGKNERLKEMSLFWTDAAETQYLLTNEKQRLFGEISYAAGTWNKERRVIVKAEYTDKGSNPRFVVTNLQGAPKSLYDDIYCARGEMENRIKEQQLYLFADRTSCHEFYANQFRLLLSSFAYVLFEALRREFLADTPLDRAQVSTIRLKLLKVAARVVVSVRRIVFHLASSYPYRSLFAQIAGALLPEKGATMAPG